MSSSSTAWGCGNSALVNRWLVGWRGNGFPGYSRVYTWSAGRQSNPNRRCWAAIHGGRAAGGSAMTIPGPGRRRRKGGGLRHLVQADPTLLVLDGLEVFQHATGRARAA